MNDNAWEPVNIAVLTAAAQGQSFDAQGQPIEAVSVLQTEIGYETRRYNWSELLGLYEVSYEFKPYKQEAQA